MSQAASSLPHRRPRYQSTWSRVRLVVHPEELVSSGAFGSLSLEAFGLLMRLAVYAAAGSIPHSERVMASVARVGIRKIRAIWPEIEPYFTRTEDGWRLSEDWCKPQLLSSDRRDLTYLLDALIDFWGSLCVYCGEPSELEIEHIVPLARGGTNEITNLTVACKSCNMKKRTQTASEFGFPGVEELARQMVLHYAS